MTQDEIREALSKPTISPAALHKTKVLPLGLAGIYQAVHAGEIPAERFGKKIAIITAPLRRKLGISDAA
jgi:hypothetical protein